MEKSCRALQPVVNEVVNRKLGQVDNLLNQNRLLMNEINQNIEALNPHGLTHNVTLIREVNNNMQRVTALYAGLSSTVRDVSNHTARTQ